MKNYIFSALIFLTLITCKENKKATKSSNLEKTETVISSKEYPKDLQNIFKAHGGLDAWKQMKSLIFTMETENEDLVITTNLNSREALLDNSKKKIGFDGKQVWLLNKTEEKYKGYNPIYEYNLMFYFYAMPFILSDDGINYAKTDPLIFDGKTYPGIEITYNKGVGETPEDRYILYYNSKTYKMEWLGYTVSFVEGIDKKELHFRRYNDWQNVNGLILPKSITGYNFKNDKPTTVKHKNVFKDIKISKEKVESSKFTKPKKAIFLN